MRWPARHASGNQSVVDNVSSPMQFWRKRRFGLILAMLVMVYLGLGALGGVAFVELSLRLPKRPITQAETTLAQRKVQELGARLQEVELHSRDGLRLAGWFVSPRMPNGSVVLLLHGVTDNRLGVGGFAELFLRHGYSVLMADSRTHGMSEGVIASYGVAESDDIRRWVDWVYRAHQPACVYGFGESMGAAILLQSLASEPRFCAVIAESAFADFREGAYDRIGGFFRTGPWLARTALRPAVESGFLYARLKYGIDFRASSPRAAVAASHVPVLLIHGEEDSVIRLRNSAAIQAANPKAMLWSVPKAEHCGAWSTQPKLFEQRVLAWFSNHRS
jgi:uncharacterized protein